MSPETCEVLLALIALGDPEAMARFHLRWRAPVVRTARDVVRDSAFAEDVAQEVFLWIWEHADGYDAGRGSVRAWLMVVARRRAVDLVRRESTWRRHNDVGVEPGADDLFAVWERSEHLRTTMAGISSDQRSALCSTFMDDNSYAQAALLLGLKPSTLRSRVHEGLLSMRLALSAPVA